MSRGVSQRTVKVALGESARDLGILTYARDGARQNSNFAYSNAWLGANDRFEISPDLALVEGRQFRKPPSRDDSFFHFAFADTEPDGWGCRVIARDHAKRRRADLAKGKNEIPAALTEMDYLLGVDDVSRIGAIRLIGHDGNFVRTIEDGARGAPPLLDLRQLIHASHAVEMNKETAADLEYLRGRGTSLGGMRPKCTLIDDDGHLAIGKFPSVMDDRSVTRGEVLALHLAALAGLNVAESRIQMSDDMPVALIRRFDRTPTGGRIPYLSAGSMLQASRQEDHAYSEIADSILRASVEPKADLCELWRRIVFSLLITNVDDHLHNHGFLHVAHGQWRLAPAFDVNPFPDKDRELKLWLNETEGPVNSIQAVVRHASYYRLTESDAQRILRQVHGAIKEWKRVATSPAVGMTGADLESFEPAFDHEQMRAAAALI